MLTSALDWISGLRSHLSCWSGPSLQPAFANRPELLMRMADYYEAAGAEMEQQVQGG